MTVPCCLPVCRTAFRGWAAAAVALGASLPAAVLAEEGAQLVSAAEMKAKVANLPEGQAYNVMRKGPNYMLLTAVRGVPGKPELHEGMADLFIALEGGAEVRVGGRLVGGKTYAPGEWMDGRIEGGEIRRLGVGDILWVPAGLPHQVTPSGGKPFRYMVVKVAKADAAALSPPPAGK